MTEAEESQLTLETITHAAQVMAGQISVDGVATALLNAGLVLSGAPRGMVVLAASGKLDATADPLLPRPEDLVLSRPRGALGRRPAPTWLPAVVERAPQIRMLQDQPSVFPNEAGAAGVSCVCTPVISRDIVGGLLYLEFDDGPEAMTNRRLATMTLLAAQAAMTLDAIRAADSQRNDPLWQSRSLTIGGVATFRWNPKTRLAEGSPEYYAILGLDPAKGPIDFATMTTLVHPADYPRAQATVDDAVRRRAPLRMEWRLLRPSGEVRDLLWSGQFDASDPDSPWMQGVVMDITDLKAADDALRLAHEDADRRLRLAWLGELAGSVVHEVNQPLGAIISSADAGLRWLQRDEPDLAAAVSSIERIRETAIAAGRTVAGMRALSSSVAAEPVERSLNAIISEALQLSSPLIGRARAKVDLIFDPAHPIVRCDQGQLLQVFMNLIRNAIDSLREVADRERTLRIRTFVRDADVVAEFEDNGLGMAPAAAERLFDPLYTTKKDGMGLGLSICRRIMVAHQGTISAKANEGFGATFTISLPRPSIPMGPDPPAL